MTQEANQASAEPARVDLFKKSINFVLALPEERRSARTQPCITVHHGLGLASGKGSPPRMKWVTTLPTGLEDPAVDRHKARQKYGKAQMAGSGLSYWESGYQILWLCFGSLLLTRNPAAAFHGCALPSDI